MNSFPMQKITIYHKTDTRYERYVKEASFRNTSILNHNRNGSNSIDNVLIRIFDISNYGFTWFASKKDVIVDMEVSDDINGTTPYTQLSQKYGKEHVFEITSVDKFNFNDEDIEDLNHIKIGAK